MPDPHSFATEPRFLPGLRLSAKFYLEAVKPILDHHLPDLRYAAALLGSGSEVLGFDTPRSTDHNWGPRLQLFLSHDDQRRIAPEVLDLLARNLPYEFHGFPTNFGDPQPDGARLLTPIGEGPVHHRVAVTLVDAFFAEEFGFALPPFLSVTDWLTMPEQRLRTITGGAVYRDDLGELKRVRSMVHYYPHDVWLYLLAAQWRRISQEEAFVGRCGEVGDELGSCIIAARLVRDLMRLCFLMERQYAPYAKWFCTGFSRLSVSPELTPILSAVLSAATWREREAHLSRAHTILATRHNALGITAPMETTVTPFHTRPFLVIHGDNFAAAISDAIESREVKSLPPNLGSVDQFVDSTDVLSYPAIVRRLRSVYRSLPDWGPTIDHSS